MSRICTMISGWPLVFNVVSEKAASCAVSFEPSWNFASGRSIKRYVNLSAEICTDLATRPYIASGSSLARTISGANVMSMP